ASNDRVAQSPSSPPAAQPPPARRRATLTRSSAAEAARQTFGKLEQTRDEIDNIGELFREAMAGRSSTLSGTAATKARLSEEIAGKRFVHLATHGYFASPGIPSALAPEDPHILSRPFEGISPSAARGYYPGLMAGLVFAGVNDPPRNPLTAVPDPSF